MINPFDRPTTYAPRIDDILYWAYEREQIRMFKLLNLPKPWTEDPILQKYRFCNVRRRDDRMSQWMISNMFDHIAHGEEDMWFIAAIARYINWPPTLTKLLIDGAVPTYAEEFDPHRFVEVMDKIKASGVKVYGSAYLIYPSRDKGVSKAETIAFRFLLPLALEANKIREALKQNSIEAMVTALSQFWGWSTFMSGQVAADLSYYPEDLGEAADLYEWAPIGPGSSLGLNMLLGRSDTANWKQNDFNKELIKIWTEIAHQLDIDEFTLHDCQNVLCEMSKYWKVLRGTGKPKVIYTPEIAY